MSKRRLEDQRLIETTTIVIDGQSVEDCWRAGLFERLLGTCYTVAVADLVWANQLGALPDGVRASFMELGLEIVVSPPRYSTRALDYKRNHPALHADECFSLAIAEFRSDSVLVATDPQLRDAALAILPARLKSPTWVVTLLDRAHEQPPAIRKKR